MRPEVWADVCTRAEVRAGIYQNPSKVNAASISSVLPNKVQRRQVPAISAIDICASSE
jgi:hypothetical protein